MSEALENPEWAALAAENAALRAAVAQLTQQLEWFKRQLFGRKSEKLREMETSVQGNLLADLAEAPVASEPPTETLTYTRRKGKLRGDAVNDSGLRFDATVPVQVIELPAPELQGPDAAAYEVISEKVTHRLAQRPGSDIVLEYRRPVLKHRESQVLTTVPAPPNVLDKSLGDVSFLAGMLIDKFCYHLPLYRQHQRLADSGITLSRSGRVVAVDETPIKAGRIGSGTMRAAYFWPVYGEAHEVCFPYASNKRFEQVRQVLGPDFEGTLLTDGYAAYARYGQQNATVTNAACWAHCRRYFGQALESGPEAACAALTQIAELYATEAWIREHELEHELEGAEKLAVRTERSVPIVKAFLHWCDEQCHRPNLLPSDRLSRALHYARERVESLQVFLTDPDVPIDTNHLERALRLIPLGRRNWLFAWTELGAKHIGIIQSLLVTCRLQGISPYTYLVDVLQRVGQHPAKEVAELTPRRWKVRFANEALRSDAEVYAPPPP